MNPERIIRVFPRRTSATPDDALAVVDRLPTTTDQADAVHVSVSWTWDLPRAEELARAWASVAPVIIGGPATGQRSGDFVAGMYVKHGYTITSRGCPNKCWFCSVWRREGDVVRELPIADGWKVLDDNLLACRDDHIRAVFGMLERQKSRPEFVGGLEAKRLKQWQAEELKRINPESMFFAYDTEDDLEPLQQAGLLLDAAGFKRTSHTRRCYVLCGWPKDTMEAAEHRMHQTLDAGFYPMAMLWRDREGQTDKEWRRFQRVWANPFILFTESRKYLASKGVA